MRPSLLLFAVITVVIIRVNAAPQSKTSGSRRGEKLPAEKTANKGRSLVNKENRKQNNIKESDKVENSSNDQKSNARTNLKTHSNRNRDRSNNRAQYDVNKNLKSQTLQNSMSGNTKSPEKNINVRHGVGRKQKGKKRDGELDYPTIGDETMSSEKNKNARYSPTLPSSKSHKGKGHGKNNEFFISTTTIAPDESSSWSPDFSTTSSPQWSSSTYSDVKTDTTLQDKTTPNWSTSTINPDFYLKLTSLQFVKQGSCTPHPYNTDFFKYGGIPRADWPGWSTSSVPPYSANWASSDSRSSTIYPSPWQYLSLSTTTYPPNNPSSISTTYPGWTSYPPGYWATSPKYTTTKYPDWTSFPPEYFNTSPKLIPGIVYPTGTLYPMPSILIPTLLPFAKDYKYSTPDPINSFSSTINPKWASYSMNYFSTRTIMPPFFNFNSPTLSPYINKDFQYSTSTPNTANSNIFIDTSTINPKLSNYFPNYTSLTKIPFIIPDSFLMLAMLNKTTTYLNSFPMIKLTTTSYPGFNFSSDISLRLGNFIANTTYSLPSTSSKFFTSTDLTNGTEIKTINDSNVKTTVLLG